VIIHNSGEKSKRGEIRFPKRGIAIFISVELRSKKDARLRVRAKDMKCHKVMIFWVEEEMVEEGLEALQK